MTKKQQNKVVPKLRFPEFNEEWEKKTLGEVVDIRSGTSPSNYTLKQSGSYPYLKVEDLNNNNKYQVVSREYTADTIGLIPEKSIIFPKRGAAIELNKVRLNIDKVAMDSNLMAITPTGDINAEYLYYLITIIGLYRIADLSTIPQINNKHIIPFEVLIPRLKEQQKIADCLSSLDELIATENEKLDGLKTYKKGLMQQLFPTAGERVPKLRFKEFRNGGEWEITTIGNIGSFYYGKSAPKWSLSANAPTMCVRYGELYTKFGTIIDKIHSRTNIDPENLRFSKGEEILVPRVGEVPKDFAKHCCYLPFPNIAIGEMISVYETEEHPIFYTHYFRTLWRQFAEVVEGQNVKNLYYVNLEPIAIGKPSRKEQQKISDTLSSLDELIDIQSERIEILKLHKKGLMQQLFPIIKQEN